MALMLLGAIFVGFCSNVKMQVRPITGFIFAIVLFAGTLKAMRPMWEEKRSDGSGEEATGPSSQEITAINRRSMERLGDTSSASQDRQGNAVAHLAETDSTSDIWRDVSSVEPSREGSPITTTTEVLPADRLEKEMVDAKKVAIALRQQLILKSYQLTLPTPRGGASATILESIGGALLSKNDKAQLEEAISSIMDEVKERMRQRGPETLSATKKLSDLENAIDQSARALRAHHAIDIRSSSSHECQIDARRVRLAEVNASAEETIRNLRIENDPSLAALIMAEVLKEKIEALKNGPLFEGGNLFPTTENFLQLSILYHLAEGTLFAAEDTFAMTAADTLKSPENNEHLHARCDQAARLVVLLRSVLLAIKKIIQSAQSLHKNIQIMIPSLAELVLDRPSYILPEGELRNNVNNQIQEQREKLLILIQLATSEISNALLLAQNIHQTLPEESVPSFAPFADAQFSSLCEKARKANLERAQASEVRYYDSSPNSKEPAYPHLSAKFCRSNLEQRKNQSSRRALSSYLDLRLSGHQYNGEFIPTRERVADIQEMIKLTRQGVDQWKQSEQRNLSLRKRVNCFSSLCSDASQHLQECSKNLNHENSPTLIRLFLASKLADASRKNLDSPSESILSDGFIPFSVQAKLPQFCKAFKNDLINCHAFFGVLIRNTNFDDGMFALSKKILALKAIASMTPVESIRHFPSEIALKEATSSQAPRELSIHHITAWNELTQPFDLTQKVKTVRAALPSMFQIHEIKLSSLKESHSLYRFQYPNQANSLSLTEASNHLNQLSDMIQNFFDFIALDRTTMGPGQRVFLDNVMRNVHESNQLMIDSMKALKNSLPNIDRAHLTTEFPLLTSMDTIGEACKRTYSDAIKAIEAFNSTINEETPLPTFKSYHDSSFLIDCLRARTRAFQQQMEPVMQPLEAALQEVRTARSTFDTLLQNELALRRPQQGMAPL